MLPVLLTTLNTRVSGLSLDDEVLQRLEKALANVPEPRQAKMADLLMFPGMTEEKLEVELEALAELFTSLGAFGITPEGAAVLAQETMEQVISEEKLRRKSLPSRPKTPPGPPATHPKVDKLAALVSSKPPGSSPAPARAPSVPRTPKAPPKPREPPPRPVKAQGDLFGGK
jgi:hypothetical protein